MNNVGIRADAMDEESFECFANELCSVLFNKSIHGFSRGADDGIDGIDNVLEPTIIVQAKRWSPYKTNAFTEINKEIKKIRKTIKARQWKGKIRYVIVTSTGISPEVQNKLRQMNRDLFCDDFCLLDYARINELSTRPELERVYSKNHLIGSNLSVVLKKDRLDAIGNDYPEFDTNFFVETAFFDKAFNIIMDKHILLVHGDPGVGKSTLCKMLGYVFANRLSLYPNSVRVLWRSPNEMPEIITLFDSTFRGSDNQLFVIIDDFLGSNFLTTNSSEMEILSRLLNRVKKSKNFYILLNSRTQILESAKMDFQDFFAELKRGYEEAIEMIDMSDYTLVDKAKLLRKNLEREYSFQKEDGRRIFETNYEKLRSPDDSNKRNSSVRKVYNSIIEHKNFNPRLIEYISQNFNAPNGVLELIRDTLDNPEYVYDPLFLKMEADEKWILFCLFTFSDKAIPEDLLISAIQPFVEPTFDPGPVLKKFEHTWIRSEMESIGTHKIGYANPGIRDYLSAKNEKIHFTDTIKKKALLLRQLQGFFSRADFDNIVIQRWQDFQDRDEYLGEYAAAYFSKGHDQEKALLVLKKILQDYTGEWHLDSSNGWLEVLLSIEEGPFDLLETAFESLVEENKNANNFSGIFETRMSLEEFDGIVNLFLPEIIRKYNIDPETQDISVLNTSSEGYGLVKLIFEKKKQLLQQVIDSFSGDYYSEVEEMVRCDTDEQDIVINVLELILNNEGGEQLCLYKQLFDEGCLIFDVFPLESFVEDVEDEVKRSENGEDEQNGADAYWRNTSQGLEDIKQIDSILDKPISSIAD